MKDNKLSYRTTMDTQGPIIYDGSTFRMRHIKDQYFIHTFNKHPTAMCKQCMIIVPEEVGKEYMEQLESNDSAIVSIVINILADRFTVLHYNIEV